MFKILSTYICRKKIYKIHLEGSGTPFCIWDARFLKVKRLYCFLSKVLALEHSFVWCWNFVTSESRSEIPGKFSNVVLERDGEDQMDRSCKK
jgi:hypothetical protein